MSIKEDYPDFNYFKIEMIISEKDNLLNTLPISSCVQVENATKDFKAKQNCLAKTE